ncbi:MAG: SAM-dependent methyltransferase [Stackebrandtia sp.]
MNDSPASEADVVNLSKSSVARAYDYLLGGKDNYEVDREFARGLLNRDSQMAITAKLNKEFGYRAVEYLARHGVKQFLDLGSGIPTSPPSVHETARRVHADAKVVYVDHDPVVAVHNRVFRAVSSGLAVIQESLTNVDRILAHEEFQSNIDLGEPVGVMFLSVLQNTPLERAVEVLARLRSRLAPGSYLAITHVSDTASASVKRMVAEKTEAGIYPQTWFRSDADILEFFTGFDLVEPGLVDYRDWRPTIAQQDDRPELHTPLRGGVGRLAG